MPQPLQPGSHLSPDQLSAFAENALPGHERRAALTHLADCADCRQVVFLIQQADPTLIAPSVETPRRGWFTLPQLFIAAGAAFACSLILALIVHQHYTGPSTPPVTTAQLHPPPAPTTPAPAPTPAQTTIPKPTVRTPKPAAPAQLYAVTPRGLMPLPAKIVVPELKAQPPAYPPRPAFLGGVNTATNSGTASQPRDLNKQSLAYDSIARSSAPPPSAPSASVDISPAPAPTFGVSPATPSVSSMDSASVHGASAQSLPTVSRAITTTAAPVAIPPVLQLPSKKPVASQLNSGSRTLALDTDGALFLSLDRGKHWTAVATQWTGKAVQLSFAPTPTRLYQVQPSQTQTQSQTGNSTNGAVFGGPLQQSPIPTAGFELTTATGVVWLSTDGLTWHAR